MTLPWDTIQNIKHRDTRIKVVGNQHGRQKSQPSHHSCSANWDPGDRQFQYQRRLVDCSFFYNQKKETHTQDISQNCYLAQRRKVHSLPNQVQQKSLQVTHTHTQSTKLYVLQEISQDIVCALSSSLQRHNSDKEHCSYLCCIAWKKHQVTGVVSKMEPPCLKPGLVEFCVTSSWTLSCPEPLHTIICIAEIDSADQWSILTSAAHQRYLWCFSEFADR